MGGIIHSPEINLLSATETYAALLWSLISTECAYQSGSELFACKRDANKRRCILKDKHYADQEEESHNPL